MSWKPECRGRAGDRPPTGYFSGRVSCARDPRRSANPRRAGRAAAAPRQHRPHAGGRHRRRRGPAPARQDAQEPDRRRRCRSRPARSASAAPSSARPRCSSTPASATSGCPIRCSPPTPAACWPCSSAPGSRSSSTTWRWRGAGRRRCRRPASASRCWSRWTSASTAAASRRTRPSAVAFLRAVDALPGLRLRGILSHAGHAYHAHSEDELRQMAVAERDLDGGDRRRGARRQPADARGQRRRHAAGPLFARGRARHVHRVPARQLRLPRSHDGRPRRRHAATTARSRCWPRWSARRRPTASSSTAAARRWPPTASAASRRRPATARSTATSCRRPASSPIRTCTSSGSRRNMRPFAWRRAPRRSVRAIACACCPITPASCPTSSTRRG